MRGKTTTKVLGALFVTVLFTILVINPAAAYDFPTAESHIVLFSNYSGDIISTFPSNAAPYNIDEPDDVVVKYNGTWDDRRSSPVANATFYYKVSAEFVDVTYWDDHTEITNGGESGWEVLQITIPDVDPDPTVIITITFNATLDAPYYYETKEEAIPYTFI